MLDVQDDLGAAEAGEALLSFAITIAEGGEVPKGEYRAVHKRLFESPTARRVANKTLRRYTTPDLLWGYLRSVATGSGSWALRRNAAHELIDNFPPVTAVIACFEEEETIEETIDYLTRQEYPGELRILIADDGSKDRTAELARARAAEDPRISVANLPHGGKANALTRALKQVETPLVVTVDADTLLMPASLERLVARLLISPPDTVAVAGAVFVRNSRSNFFTKAQEWDYFLGIASVKRQQGLFQGTMVAQGAFSVYRTAALSAVGGWPDRIGEDIVLTWALMRAGGRVGYERTAIAVTGAPEDAKAFARQRRRWARGMIEGLREHGGALLAAKRSNAHAVLVNFVFPYVDLVYSIAFPIGIVLACFGNFAIVGPMTVIVLPLNLALSMIMLRLSRQSFTEVGLKLRQNRLGFLGYLLAYQLFMSPVSVAGYAQELVGAARRW